MRLLGFQVFTFRNIIDSGWVNGGDLISLIAQNECGKSNLLEALYKLNPYERSEKYNLIEDWPVDLWPAPKEAKDKVVCRAKFRLTGDEYCALATAAQPKTAEGQPEAVIPSHESNTELLDVVIERTYSSESRVSFHSDFSSVANAEAAKKWILENAPKCVYMQDYGFFAGTTELNELRERLNSHGKDRSKLSRADQTVLVVLDLAQIDLDDLASKGNSKEQRSVRGYDTRAASSYLSKQFERLWGQKDVRFDIRVDANTLEITVEDSGVGMPVRLHRRSRGFQWYVSFTMMFTHASSGDFKNCVLLLDEPGVHLHPAAHRDLLSFLERLSKSNTVLYTTHLATMLDPEFPERVRIMEVADHHATVKNTMYSGQTAPMMVIEQVLGLSPDMSGLLGSRQTLIVEGGEDAVILEKLSGLLGRVKAGEGLSDRIFVWPAKGAAKTPMYAGFMVGHKLDAAVLLDSDPEGQSAASKIKELYLDTIANEANKKFRVLMLGDAAGIKKNESAIEDIFPEEFLVQCTADAYGIKLSVAELPTDGSDQVVKRIERALQARSIAAKLDKRRVLLQILERFNAMNDVSDLPSGTYERAARLFAKINAAFGEASGQPRPKATAGSKRPIEAMA